MNKPQQAQDYTPLNQARERGLYAHLKTNYGEGEWAEVNIPFGDVTMTHCRAYKGIVEVVVSTADGRGKTNFKDLIADGKVQSVEYAGLVLLCHHFHLFFDERGICLN